MNDRDTLIELLTDADMQRNDWDQSTYEAQADALLAAGWRAPEPPHRHQWAVGGFGTGVTGHPVAPRWSCACGAIKYGTVGDADDYKHARGQTNTKMHCSHVIVNRT